MKQLFIKLIQSLEANKSGFSGRKLSAMAAIVTGIFTTIKIIPKEQQLHALYAWQIFALVCLGLVTIPELIKFLSLTKNGKNDPESETNPTNGGDTV